MVYDLKSPQTPRLVGNKLRMVARLSEGPMAALLWRTMAETVGLPRFRQASAEDAPLAPLPVLPPVSEHSGDSPASALDPPALDPSALDPSALEKLARSPSAQQGFKSECVADFLQAYKSGSCTPEIVAERVINAIVQSEATNPNLNIFFAHHADDVRTQAKASNARWKAGQPLGPLDGVPVAIKDEVDMKGYPTTQGTTFMGRRGPATRDGTSVARLRAAGALLLGKANMTEIGINPIGHQPHHGTARNPFHPQHFTGGSSSGPGAAVASGLCPLALGADGGGSIRIPASLCGVVGLKATFGRVSEHGVPPICWSVAHLGPLAASARDCALGYALLAGHDEHDRHTWPAPAVDLKDLTETDLSGMTLGVFSPWFDDADPQVVKSCRALLAAFVDRGARLKEIEIPELETMRVAHLVTIGTEMLAAQAEHLREHRSDFAPDVRILMASIERFLASDYVHAQRHRHRACERFDRLLKEVDVIVTPTSACTAPPIRADALGGESDLTTLSKVMRFVVAGNLTGLPAISFPAGYDDAGLPIGFQALGRAWEESLLLRLAVTAEEIVEHRRPKHHWRLLEG